MDIMSSISTFIQSKKAKISASGGNLHNKYIKLMIPNDEIINIVENAVKASNRK
jgi:hypothetical protein